VVDMNKIKRSLKEDFLIADHITIDPHTGVVDVQGDVQLIADCDQMSVKFGKVSGDFNCADRGLTTLAGSPHHVVGQFSCEHNRLTSLAHAPHHVDGVFSAPYNHITHLTHMPTYVGASFWIYGNPLESLSGLDKLDQIHGELWCTYSDQLPLLRTVLARSIHLSDGEQDTPIKLDKIIKKYVGKGKSHMLNLALELKQAGFEGNAKW
jgi:hypothetical protein